MISYAVIFIYIAVALGEYSSWKRLLVRLCRVKFNLSTLTKLLQNQILVAKRLSTNLYILNLKSKMFLLLMNVRCAIIIIVILILVKLRPQSSTYFIVKLFDGATLFKIVK